MCRKEQIEQERAIYRLILTVLSLIWRHVASTSVKECRLRKNNMLQFETTPCRFTNYLDVLETVKGTCEGGGLIEWLFQEKSFMNITKGRSGKSNFSLTNNPAKDIFCRLPGILLFFLDFSEKVTTTIYSSHTMLHIEIQEM